MCTFQAKPGEDKCGRHMIVDAEDRCRIRLKNGQQCSRERHNVRGECSYHETIRINAERYRRIYNQYLVIRQNLQDMMLERGYPDDASLRRLTMYMANAMMIEGISYEDAIRQFTQPTTELAAVAQDKQNVHTTRINKQTADGLDFLFRHAVHAEQNTLREFAVMIVCRGMGQEECITLLSDMAKWYTKTQCREEGDSLYKRTIDHLWAYITSIEDQATQTELETRLIEECTESINMCCDGHISRLVNVLIGFTDLNPTVPVGELLQQKMSQISQIENVEERMQQARIVFAELNVSPDDAGPWLEALA